LAIAALLCIWFFRQALEMDRHHLQYVFGAIYGGIAGNLADRLFRGGEVVDFIDFTFLFIPTANDFLTGIRNFPVFNLADSAIFVGVVCYLILGFADARRSKAETTFADSSTDDS
jgi:signal peptidase II